MKQVGQVCMACTVEGSPARQDATPMPATLQAKPGYAVRVMQQLTACTTTTGRVMRVGGW